MVLDHAEFQDHLVFPRDWQFFGVAELPPTAQACRKFRPAVSLCHLSRCFTVFQPTHMGHPVGYSGLNGQTSLLTRGVVFQWASTIKTGRRSD